jgi:hypothetical protein
MKYPVKGTIKKTYIAVPYTEKIDDEPVEKITNIEYEKAIADETLTLGETTLSLSELLELPLEEKVEDILIIATRISYNYNVQVTNAVPTNESSFSAGGTQINVPKLMYEIVDKDGSPSLTDPSLIKFDLKELNKQL